MFIAIFNVFLMFVYALVLSLQLEYKVLVCKM